MTTPEALNGAQATVQHPEHLHVRDSRALRVFGERTSRVIREATTLSVLNAPKNAHFFFGSVQHFTIFWILVLYLYLYRIFCRYFSKSAADNSIKYFSSLFRCQSEKVCAPLDRTKRARKYVFFESSLCGSVLKTPKNCSSITVL